MKFLTSIILAAALIRSSNATGEIRYCISTKTVTTTPTGFVPCPACFVPTSTCSPGEPSTRPLPRITQGCTVSVINRCPCQTCVAELSTKSVCTSFKTTTSKPAVICDIACIVPEASTCKPGEPTGPPATITTTSGCAVSVIGKGFLGCASCVPPNPTS
ncbi:hypothetical protein SCUP234_11319 [Seiridium cupressi]